MIFGLYRLIYILLSVAIWFNGSVFQIGRASVRIEHFLAILLFIIEFCIRRIEKRPLKLNWLFWFWITLGAISTYLGTIDVLRGFWIQAQYVIGLIFLSSREVFLPRRNAIGIQARIAILISLIYLSSYAYSPLGDFIQISGERNIFAGYSLEPNLMGSQALLLWILLCMGRDLLSRAERVSLILLPAIVFISLTRAVWLSFICIAAVLAVRRLQALSIYYFLLILVSFPLLVVYIGSKVTSSEDIYWNLNNFVNLQSGTARYRQNVYSQALSEIPDSWLHLWFGHGFASFPEIHPVDSSGVTSAYLSNAFIGLLFETGVLGAFIFLILIGLFVYGSLRRFEVSLYSVALTIVSLTTSPLWLVYPWFYLKILGGAQNEKTLTG